MENTEITYETFEPVNSSLRLAFPGTDGPLGRMVYRKDAMKFLGVTRQTLSRYEADGRLKRFKNQVNGRIYYNDVDLLAVLGSRVKHNKQAILYCRTAVLGSSPGRAVDARDRLAAQKDRMQAYCTMAGIRVDRVISDIGSGSGKVGLDGIDSLMEAVLRKEVDLVIVETHDRLARWSVGAILDRFLAWHGVKLHVANPVLTREEYREELKQDLAEVLYDAKVALGEL